MSEIVRTPTRVAGGITPAEQLLLAEHTKRWIDNAMSTEPVNHDRLTAAIKSLYAAANQKEPRVVIVPSPIVMAFAGGFSAAVWWARQQGGIATDDATDDAACAATRGATYTATYDATDDASDDATLAATDDATDAAAYAATRDATYAATEDATLAAMDDATDAATDAATLAATYTATYTATDAATDAATRAATRDATDDATYAAAYADGNKFAAIAARLGAEFGISPRLMLQCARRWYSLYQGGNMWSAWDCYLTAFRDVLGLNLKHHEKYRAWEACAVEGGFRFMHKEFCIVSDRPERLLVDDQNRPHCADGPSHRWRDGWSLYHWHGMRIPAEREYIIHSPEQITVAKIEAETNAEIRRVMMERYGYERYMRDCNAVVVDQLPVDHPIKGLRDARLLVKNVRDDEPIVYVDLLNSTPEPDGSVKRYMLRVDPNAYYGAASRSAHAAAASTWRNRDGTLTYERFEDYRPQAES